VNLNELNPLKARLYFECHVTIEPVFDDDIGRAQDIALKHGFRIADLLMLKRKEDTPFRSQYDTFMTGRSVELLDLSSRMEALIIELNQAGFKVWRAKIEDTLFDTKCKDTIDSITLSTKR
jgi:hypothetical protein